MESSFEMSQNIRASDGFFKLISIDDREKQQIFTLKKLKTQSE